MSREYGVGPVPEADVIGEELHDFLVQLRRSYMDVGKTVQRAVAAAGGTSTSGSSTIIIDGGSGGTYTPDLTPPPTPSGVLAVAGIDFVGITTDAPTFTAGHGYGRTIVYGTKYSGTGPLPTFSSAVVVHEFVGAVGSFPTEPATQWHLWLKWRSVDGVLSSSPSGGTNGHTVTTGQDVTKLLDALSGAITRDEISADVWRTNTFAIAPPAGSPLPEVLPFIVQTSPTTLNGATIPAGVYIDSGYIRDLTAVVARMGNAWITSAMVASLAASKITAGSVDVGEYIQSSNYVAGTSGWRIHGDGTAEFGAASIRGQLVASQIDTRNLTVKDAAGAVIFGASQNLDINRLAAGVDFQPDIAWDFTGTADGWTANSATLTLGTQEIYVGSTTADPNFISPVISISGARSPLIRMRILKGAGSWEGLIFFQTAGHGFSGSYYKAIPAPPDNVWTTIEVDMSSLTVGGSDWTASTIERLRFDFFNASGATIAIDWIAIGRQGPLRITGANATTFIADAAIGTAQIGELNASKITAGSITTDRLQIGAVSQFAAVSWAASAMTVLSNTSAILPALDAGSFTRAIAGRAIRISVEASVEIDIRASGFTAGHYMPEIQFWVGTSSLSRLHKVRLPSGYIQPGMPRIYWPVNFATMSSDNTMFPVGVAKQIRISVDFFQFLDPSTALGVPCITSAAVNANVVAEENKV